MIDEVVQQTEEALAEAKRINVTEPVAQVLLDLSNDQQRILTGLGPEVRSELLGALEGMQEMSDQTRSFATEALVLLSTDTEAALASSRFGASSEKPALAVTPKLSIDHGNASPLDEGKALTDQGNTLATSRGHAPDTADGSVPTTEQGTHAGPDSGRSGADHREAPIEPGNTPPVDHGNAPDAAYKNSGAVDKGNDHHDDDDASSVVSPGPANSANKNKDKDRDDNQDKGKDNDNDEHDDLKHKNADSKTNKAALE